MVLVTKTKRSTKVHTQKRHGRHHQPKDAHYLKTYWPYLPLALIVGLGLLLSSAWGVVQTNVLGYATDTTVSGLLQYTNNERVNNGVGSLTLHHKLNAAAQAKANDMAARDYWSHNTPEGNPPWVFFEAAGYAYVAAGENLAYGFDNSGTTVVAWMNSPGHRANILNKNFVEVGFGIANAANYQGTGPETIVVAMYGSQVAGATAPVASPPPAAPTSAPAPTPTPVAATPAPAPTPQPAPEPTPASPSPEQNSTPTVSRPTPVPADTRTVSRIQLLSNGSAPWSMFAVSALATISIAVFFLRHGLLWHRVLVRGEAFVHRHHFLDIALVSLAAVGYVLTRADGLIR